MATIDLNDAAVEAIRQKIAREWQIIGAAAQVLQTEMPQYPDLDPQEWKDIQQTAYDEISESMDVIEELKSG